MKQKEYRETYSPCKEHHGVAAQWFCFGLRRGNRHHLARLSVPDPGIKIDLGKAPS
jgi:hypothetical protein